MLDRLRAFGTQLVETRRTMYLPNAKVIGLK